jgi:hypothetical protein
MIALRWRAGSSVNRSKHLLTFIASSPFHPRGGGGPPTTGRIQIHPTCATLAVEAEIDDHARKPRPELRQGLPARRIGPDAYESLLRNVLRFPRIAENASSEPDHRRQMAARKQLECPLVAARNAGHERLVAVIHCNAMAAIRNAQPF